MKLYKSSIFTYLLHSTYILTPKAMGCLRLVYHGGGHISAPMAPMDMKLYMLVVFGLYF